MCLYSKQGFKNRKEAREFKKNPPRTNKDVVVYKILNNSGTSPCQGFKYEKGYQYTESKLSLKEEYLFFGWKLEVNEGLHAYISRKAASNSYYRNGKKVVKMVIPKGSVVIYGSNGDIVTDNLIWY